MTLLLPPNALAPFAEEISGRQKRRERRAEQEAKAAESEAAAAAAAAAAASSRGLSAQELKVSPLDPLLSVTVCAFMLSSASIHIVYVQQ